MNGIFWPLDELVYLIVMAELVGRKVKGWRYFFTIILGALVLNGVAICDNNPNPFAQYFGWFVKYFVACIVSEALSGKTGVRTIAGYELGYMLHSFPHAVILCSAYLNPDDVANIEFISRLISMQRNSFYFALGIRAFGFVLALALRPVFAKLSKAGPITLWSIWIVAAFIKYGSIEFVRMVGRMTITAPPQRLMLFYGGVVLLLLIIFIAVLIILYERKQKRMSARLEQLKSAMLEENYKALHEHQQKLSREIHDFTNHIRTIDGLTPDDGPAKPYLASLLHALGSRARVCHSGNDVIDSIINLKYSEAQEHDISFTFEVNVKGELPVSPVDICTVLANQLDNALEACREVPVGTESAISAEIRQQGAMLFFKVTNTCHTSPFNENGKLAVRSREGRGFGIVNIAETAEKYGGQLSNEWSDGVFTSVAMLQIPELMQ